MDVRRNIYSLSTAELKAFLDAVNSVKTNGVYDQFVTRHHEAMMAPTLLPGETGGSFTRNVAHRGPAFCLGTGKKCVNLSWPCRLPH